MGHTLSRAPMCLEKEGGFRRSLRASEYRLGRSSSPCPDDSMAPSECNDTIARIGEGMLGRWFQETYQR